MYNKKILSEIKLGKEKKSHPYKNDMIVDPMGQWKHPGENTRIPGNNITMQGVNYPVLGVGSDGQKQMMYPGQDYQFPGASYVDEYPQMRRGGVLPKAQTGNNYGCGTGMQWDPISSTCVPIPRPTIVQDYDDPRYQRFLEQENLYKYSLLDNFNQRNDLMPADVLLGDFSAWDRDRQEFKSYEPNEEYPYFWDDDDSTGPFGSQAIENYISKSELRDFINAPQFPYLVGMGAWGLDEGKDILKKYPPAGYHTYDEYGSSPFTHTFDINSGTRYGSNRHWTKPSTAFVEDEIDREALKQVYPLMTDAEIDEHIANTRRAPAYITNYYDPYYNSYQFGQRFSNQIPKTEDGLFDKTYQITRAEVNDPDNYYPSGMSPRKAYLQESETDDIYRSGEYLPVWGPPQERYDYIPKLEIKPIEPTEDEIIPVDYTPPTKPRKIRIDNNGEEWELIEEPTYRDVMEYGQYSDGTYYPKGRKKVQSGTQQRWVKKYTEEEPSFLNMQTGTYSGYKRGGGVKTKKYSRSLEATNKLFSENSLLKKLKSRKKKIYDPKAKYYQEGGITSQEEMDAANNAMMKARLAYADMHGNTAAQRMIVAPDEPYDFGNGLTGTHYMASMDEYAVPQIQNKNGQLMLGDYDPASNEAIRFDNADDAQYFGENYKTVSPGFIELELTPEEIEQYQQGGYIVEDISVPELNQAQKGGTKQSSLYIANPKEYAYRKAAYDDSLMLYKNNKEFIEAKEALVKADARLNRNYNKKNVKVFNEAQRLLNNVSMKQHMYHLEREDDPLLKGLVNVADRPVNTHYAFKNSSGFDRPVQHIYKKKKKVTEPKFERTMVDEVPEVPVTDFSEIRLPIKPLDSGIPISANEITSLNLEVPKVNQANTIEAEDVSTKMPIYETKPVYGYRPDGSAYIKEYKKVIVGYQDVGGKNYKRVPFDLRPYQKGGAKKRKAIGISDPKEYEYRKAAYDDSLWLYNNNLQPLPNKRLELYTNDVKLKQFKHKDSTKALNSRALKAYNETFAKNIQLGSPYYKDYQYKNYEDPNYRALPENLPVKLDTRKYYYDAHAVENPFTGTVYGVTAPWEEYVVRSVSSARYKKPVQPVYLAKKGDKDKDKNKDKGKDKDKSKSKSRQTNKHYLTETFQKANAKKHPPIYLTDPNDPRIGMFTKEGNQYLYRPTNVVKEKVVTEPEVNFDDIRLPLRPINTIPLMGATEEPRSLNLGAPKFEFSNKISVDNYGQEYVSQKVPIYDWKVVHTEDPNMPGRYITKRIKYIAGYEEVGGMNTTKEAPTVYDLNKAKYQKGGIAMGQEVELTPAQEAHLRKLGYKLERIK